MSDPRHYNRAHITEAVLDIRVNLPKGASLSQLKTLRDQEASGYPTCDNSMTFIGELTAGVKVGATASQTPNGYICKSVDGRQIFQARLDGFTFSRLPQYDRWETVRDEARRLWNSYRDAARPETINRVAVRYINRLDIPLPISDFKDYLRTVPEVSPELPQGLSAYFMQLQIPQNDLKVMLIINQGLIPSPKPEVVSLLLDFDLFRATDLPADEAGVWDIFEQLHVRKNEVFEACITDKTRELLK